MSPKRTRGTAAAEEQNEEQEHILTIETVKRMLKEQEETMKRHFEIALARANDKIEELTKEVTELKKANNKLTDLPKIIGDLEISDEYTQKDMERIQQSINEQASVEVIEQDIKEIKEQVLYLENQSRRCNIRVDGIPESLNEDWDTAERKLQAALIQKLNLDEDYKPNIA